MRQYLQDKRVKVENEMNAQFYISAASCLHNKM